MHSNNGKGMQEYTKPYFAKALQDENQGTVPPNKLLHKPSTNADTNIRTVYTIYLERYASAATGIEPSICLLENSEKYIDESL